MAKWCVFVVILALAVASTARNIVPSNAGLKDQKNFMSYGGVGSYSGIGSNGLPFGGVGGGVGGQSDGGLGGGIGGTVGFGQPGGGAGTGTGTGITGGGVLPDPFH